MKQPILTVALLAGGLVLMFAGPLAVGWLLPETAVWTDQDAAALSQAGADLHAAMHTHGKEDHAGHEHSATPLAAAESAYSAQQQRLDASRAQRGWLLFGVRAFGVVLALAGLCGYLIGWIGRQSA
jgi:hypothetical protein